MQSELAAAGFHQPLREASRLVFDPATDHEQVERLSVCSGTAHEWGVKQVRESVDPHRSEMPSDLIVEPSVQEAGRGFPSDRGFVLGLGERRSDFVRFGVAFFSGGHRSRGGVRFGGRHEGLWIDARALGRGWEREGRAQLGQEFEAARVSLAFEVVFPARGLEGLVLYLESVSQGAELFVEVFDGAVSFFEELVQAQALGSRLLQMLCGLVQPLTERIDLALLLESKYGVQGGGFIRERAGGFEYGPGFPFGDLSVSRGEVLSQRMQLGFLAQGGLPSECEGGFEFADFGARDAEVALHLWEIEIPVQGGSGALCRGRRVVFRAGRCFGLRRGASSDERAGLPAAGLGLRVRGVRFVDCVGDEGRVRGRCECALNVLQGFSADPLPGPRVGGEASSRSRIEQRSARRGRVPVRVGCGTRTPFLVEILDLGRVEMEC